MKSMQSPHQSFPPGGPVVWCDKHLKQKGLEDLTDIQKDDFRAELEPKRNFQHFVVPFWKNPEVIPHVSICHSFGEFELHNVVDAPTNLVFFWRPVPVTGRFFQYLRPLPEDQNALSCV